MYSFIHDYTPTSKTLLFSQKLHAALTKTSSNGRNKIGEKALYNCKFHGNSLTPLQASALAKGKAVSVPPGFASDYLDSLSAYRQLDSNKIQGVRDLKRVRRGFLRTAPVLRGKNTSIVIVGGKSRWKFCKPQDISTELTDLFRWKKKFMRQQQNSLLASVIFFYRFLAIHPFHDGNGRSSRVILNSLLYDAYGKKVFSFNFEKALFRKRRYFETTLFEKMLVEQSLEPGVRFLLKVFEESLES